MSPAVLLQWHYLIYLAPLMVAAILLLLSTVHGVHHHAGGGHGHIGSVSGGHGSPAAAHAPTVAAGGHGAAAHSHAAHAHPSHGAARSGRAGQRSAEARNGPVWFGLLRPSRAPLPIVIEAFLLIWGLAGCLLNQVLVKGDETPTLLRMLPGMGLAMLCALVGARAAAAVIGGVLPNEETQAVSRNGLIGLKGTVAFPVTAAGGRIMVYDDFGSLHDESCRVAEGHPAIERGSAAIVLDRDSQGNLVVEEIPQ